MPLSVMSHCFHCNGFHSGAAILAVFIKIKCLPLNQHPTCPGLVRPNRRNMAEIFNEKIVRKRKNAAVAAVSFFKRRVQQVGRGETKKKEKNKETRGRRRRRRNNKNDPRRKRLGETLERFNFFFKFFYFFFRGGWNFPDCKFHLRWTMGRRRRRRRRRRRMVVGGGQRRKVG